MAGEDVLPVRGRTQIDFAQLDELMSNAFMVDVIDSGADYYFKYFGDLMTVFCGVNLCGQHLSEVASAALSSSLKESYAKVVRARQPAYLKGHYVRNTVRLPIERLQIPVLDENGIVVAIWGVVIPDLTGLSLAALEGDGPARLVGSDTLLPLD